MTDSIREALEAAISDEKLNDEPTTQAPEEVAGEADGSQGGTVAAEKTEESQEVTKEPTTPVKREDVTPDPYDKVPISWKAGAKERWKDLPRDAREEIIRREREISVGLQQAAEKSKFADNFARVVEPYRAAMAAEGVQDPVVAVQNLLQTANVLRMGTPIQKATTMAKLIEYYGIDLQALDSILSGNAQQATSESARLEELLNQRLAPIQQMLQTQQQSATQYIQQEAASAIANFVNSGKAEFFEEVREDMADLLDMASKRGRKMSIEDAYERACLAHPEISQIVQRRKMTPSIDVTRAKVAASSVSGAPTPTVTAQGDDIRSALLAAMNKNVR